MKYIRAYLLLKLFLAIVVPSLIVVIVMSPLYQRVSNSAQAQEQIVTHFENSNMITALGQYVIDAETGVRGFALTGREPFLEPYFAALVRLEQNTALLTQRFAGQSQLLSQLEELQRNFELWQRNFAEEEITLIRQGLPVTELLAPAKQQMDLVRQQVRLLSQTHNTLLQASRSAQIEQTQSAVLLASVGLVAALLIGLLLAFLIAYSISARVREINHVATKVKQGDLSQRLVIRGKDELSQLADTFNAMAETLERKVQVEQQARVALNLQVEQLVAAKTRESKLISEFSELLQACESITEASAVVKQTVLRLFSGSSGALYYSSDDSAECLISWGDLTTPAFCRHDDCWSMRRGKNHLFARSRHDLACAHTTPDCNAALCVPLLARGDVAGFLHLCVPLHLTPEQGISWLEQAEDVAVNIAEHIALALANLRLREHLKALSFRDPLTGLYNRRYLDDYVERELARAARSSQSLAFLMLDIDHFKQFNDRYGHQAGDEVLLQVSQLLQQQIRSSDLVCRQGGEEFVVVIPDLQSADAIAKADAIRQQIALYPFDISGQQLGVTVSIGVAWFPVAGETLEEILKQADSALYLAKQQGRNCVRSFKDLAGLQILAS